MPGLMDRDLLAKSAHLVEAVNDPSIVSGDPSIQAAVTSVGGRLRDAHDELDGAAKGADEGGEQNKVAAAAWELVAFETVREYVWLQSSIHTLLLDGPPEMKDALPATEVKARERFMDAAFPLPSSILAGKSRAFIRKQITDTCDALAGSPYATSEQAARLQTRLSVLSSSYDLIVAEEADDGPIMNRLLRARLEAELQYRCFKGLVNVLLESEHSDTRLDDLLLRTPSSKKAAQPSPPSPPAVTEPANADPDPAEVVA